MFVNLIAITLAEHPPFLGVYKYVFHIHFPCMDCIFSSSQIIEKHREFNIPTYIAFVDFKKAFDSVDREKLWTIL